MEKLDHKGCCKDKQMILQIEKDQKKSEPAFQSLNINAEAIAVTYAESPSLLAIPVTDPLKIKGFTGPMLNELVWVVDRPCQQSEIED
ncbi:hypothetical protein [Sediminibacterium sp.]|uniref:hypothetical protein n=1 Tax=Sediminibacterium sp. TaxID=1917865 RepID=UPI0027320660|nr:hypothetical protein [Sediminibacterium sp.]MDP2421485.1 hypothetical protein [Sediminibacterium sp.]